MTGAGTTLVNALVVDRSVGDAAFRPPTLRAAVIFGDGDDSPFTRWLPSGWRHVELIVELWPNHWLAIDVVHSRVFLRPYEVKADDYEAALREAGATVLWGRVQADYRRRLGFRAVLSCVELTKAIVGVHARLVLTPRQLYRHLTSLGGWTADVRIVQGPQDRRSRAGAGAGAGGRGVGHSAQVVAYSRPPPRRGA